MVGNHCTYILFRFYVVWWWTIRNQINENCELISEVEFKTSTRLSSSTKSRLDQDRFTIHAILSDIYEILHLTFKNIVIMTIECTTQYPVVGSRKRSVFWSNKDREGTDSPDENLFLINPQGIRMEHNQTFLLQIHMTWKWIKIRFSSKYLSSHTFMDQKGLAMVTVPGKAHPIHPSAVS